MIYLDYNATTPVHPEVLDTMLPYFSEKFANPTSRTHELGRQTYKVISECRLKLASLFSLESKYVIFTSGATEANNLVILGIKKHLKEIGRTKIITSEFEHKSVLDPINHLQEEGFEIIYIKPKKTGYICPEDFAKVLDEKTGLVSLMHVNNELGTIQPVQDVASLAKEVGAFVHVDGAQGFCKVPLNLNQNIDYYTASAHKTYGPKGIGCLFINGRKSRKPLQPIIFGGGHEGGLRSGTLPTPLIAGFAKASEVCQKLHSKVNRKKLLSVLNSIKSELAQSPLVRFNVEIDSEIANTLNFRIQGVKSEALFLRLKGLALSNGSACTSHDYQPSHVLKAIGLTDEDALSSIRLSIGYNISQKEASQVVKELKHFIH